MTQHTCPRCGQENACGYGSWRDRHPAAAVCAGVFVGLPALFLLSGIVLAYPWFTFPLTVVAAAAWLNNRARRRAAIAARADHEHRVMMAQSLQPDPPASPPAKGPWHVMTHYPTTKMRSPLKDRW